MVVMILRRSYSFLVGILLLLCGSLSDAGSAEEVIARGQIWATYDVDLAGFNLGQARFRARFQASTYQLQGKGRFSLLAGQLYSGAGTTTSNGKLAKTEPEPSFFTLSYEGGGKNSVIHFILIVVLVVVGISSHDARHYRPSGNLRHARRDRGRRARRRACPARGLWIPMTAAFEIASMRGLVALAYPVKCTA
jgi:hypothetical protein